MKKSAFASLFACLVLAAFTLSYGEGAPAAKPKPEPKKQTEADYVKRIKQLTEDSTKQSKRIADLEREAARRDSLLKVADARDKQNAQQVRDKDARIAQLFKDSVSAVKTYQALELQHKNKEGQIVKLTGDLDSARKNSQALLQQIRNLEKEIQELKQYKEELERVLSGWALYFKAERLLSQKFDAEKIKKALAELNKIELKQRPEMLAELKERLSKYEKLNTNLKAAIEEINKLDADKAGGSPNSPGQTLKRRNILLILAGYTYNNDSYIENPYLAESVNKIIIRKHENADESIKDIQAQL